MLFVLARTLSESSGLKKLKGLRDAAIDEVLSSTTEQKGADAQEPDDLFQAEAEGSEVGPRKKKVKIAPSLLPNTIVISLGNFKVKVLVPKARHSQADLTVLFHQDHLLPVFELLQTVKSVLKLARGATEGLASLLKLGDKLMRSAKTTCRVLACCQQTALEVSAQSAYMAHVFRVSGHCHGQPMKAQVSTCSILAKATCFWNSFSFIVLLQVWVAQTLEGKLLVGQPMGEAAARSRSRSRSSEGAPKKMLCKAGKGSSCGKLKCF